MNNCFVDRCFFGCVDLNKGDNFLVELIIMNVNDNDVKKIIVLFFYYYYLLEIFVYCRGFF